MKMLRQITRVLALITVLVLVAACDSDQSSSPYVGYLEEEISPCTPVEGSSVDPCEPGASWSLGSGGVDFGDKPLGIGFSLGEGTTVYVAHLVLRGTYLPGTVRCNVDDKLFRPPSHSESLANLGAHKSVKCYADVRVNAYVLGSGPPTLTVMVWRKIYWFTTEQEVMEELRNSFERVLTGGGELTLDIGAPPGGIEGREAMLFLGPSVDTSAEVWEVFDTWDVERQEGSTVIAVHPFRDGWKRRTDDYETHRSALEMDLDDFTEAVKEVNGERIDEDDGRIGADEDLPMLVTDANRLRQYYVATGSYNHPDGPPKQPPPPCGLAVPNQSDNPGLMTDCLALLAAKDTLRGTGSLNWDLDTPIANWDGVTVQRTPKRVTKLLLANKSLTGSIPDELGGLTGLQEIRLSGNSFTGCIPVALEDVATNDLASLNLLYCQPPALESPSVAPAGGAE